MLVLGWWRKDLWFSFCPEMQSLTFSFSTFFTFLYGVAQFRVVIFTTFFCVSTFSILHPLETKFRMPELTFFRVILVSTGFP